MCGKSCLIMLWIDHEFLKNNKIKVTNSFEMYIVHVFALIPLWGSFVCNSSQRTLI